MRKNGLKRIINILKKRLHLPRLTELHQELIWSPDHIGKFFLSFPKKGIW